MGQIVDHDETILLHHKMDEKPKLHKRTMLHLAAVAMKHKDRIAFGGGKHILPLSHDGGSTILLKCLITVKEL